MHSLWICNPIHILEAMFHPYYVIWTPTWNKLFLDYLVNIELDLYIMSWPKVTRDKKESSCSRLQFARIAEASEKAAPYANEQRKAKVSKDPRKNESARAMERKRTGQESPNIENEEHRIVQTRDKSIKKPKIFSLSRRAGVKDIRSPSRFRAFNKVPSNSLEIPRNRFADHA